MAVETEIKLTIPDRRFIERIMSDELVTQYLKTSFAETEMLSRYYDTPSGALNERKWALRLRDEGGRSVAALKATGTLQADSGLYLRNEWEWPAQTIESGIEGLMAQGAPPELAGLTSGGNLVERCRLRFTRTSGLLYMPGGVRVDLAIDCGEIEAGEKREGLLELELELLFGGREALLELSGALREKHGLSVQLLSKYERALRLIRSRRKR